MFIRSGYTISFNNEKEVDYDCFFYDFALYVPLKETAELMGRTAVYDMETESVRMEDTFSETFTESAELEGERVTARFNTIHIYCRDNLSFSSYLKRNLTYSPRELNINGHIYIPLADLTEAYGYYRYYDEFGNVIIAKSSGRLKIADKAFMDNEFYEAGRPEQIEADSSLMEEVRNMNWSSTAERGQRALFEDECEIEAFTYKGKKYLLISRFGHDLAVHKNGYFCLDGSFGPYWVYEIIE